MVKLSFIPVTNAYPYCRVLRFDPLKSALRYPNKAQEIPARWIPTPDQIPLICLLDDDDLITRFNVNVDRLLRNASTDDVVMIITVKVKGIGARVGSLSLIL